MDISKDITYHYISRLRHHTDELGIVVQGHLLIEFVLNEIVRRKLKSPTAILGDHRSYTFSIKARLLYSAGFLPSHVFRNIQRVNAIRNRLAHRLQWSTLKLDYRFSRHDEEVSGDVEVRDQRSKRPATPRQYIKMLCLGTLSQLRNHYLNAFGALPVPEDEF